MPGTHKTPFHAKGSRTFMYFISHMNFVIFHSRLWIVWYSCKDYLQICVSFARNRVGHSGPHPSCNQGAECTSSGTCGFSKKTEGIKSIPYTPHHANSTWTMRSSVCQSDMEWQYFTSFAVGPILPPSFPTACSLGSLVSYHYTLVVHHIRVKK